MNITKKHIFYISLLIIGFLSPAQYSKIAFGNLYILWISAFAIFLLIPYIKNKYNNYHISNYTTIYLFLIWVAIGTFRGIIIADNYWEYKNLISGILQCSIPALTLAFCPQVINKFYKLWIKWCIPAFFILYIWIISPGEVNFYLAPLFVLGIFVSLMPNKWKIIIGGIFFYMLIADFGARSQIIKTVFTIILAIFCILKSYINIKILKITHWLCYCFAIVLISLGITGEFSFFENLSNKNKGKFVQIENIHGKVIKKDFSQDTRTFIYKEVIFSAIKNDYILFGRSLARGNDSKTFGKHMAEELKTGKYERYQNELCHLNIFTWLGIVGVILYSSIYIRSSYLALYKSNNYYLKLIGFFIAFHWLYGWIENNTTFNIANISLWSAIAIGLSCQFREMTDKQFVEWFKNIFK